MSILRSLTVSLIAASAGVLSLHALADAAGTDVQMKYYQGLVKRGVPSQVALLVTADTTVISEDAEHVHFIQKFVGGAKREVRVTLKSGPPEKVKHLQAPIGQEDGSITLAERMQVRSTAAGYEVTSQYLIPASSLPAETGKALSKQEMDSGWLSLLGTSNVWAQAGNSGMAVSSLQTFSAPPSPTSGTGLNMQTLTQDAGKMLDSSSLDLLKTASDVADALRKQGPPLDVVEKAAADKILDGVKNAAKVVDLAGKWGKIWKEHDARMQRLRALKKCAENPTQPTAKRAQKDDPNYRKSTTDVLEVAERDLIINSGIRFVSSTTNAVASVLLSKAVGSAKAKPVSLIDKVEDGLLRHVADEYIMKDAGKGVVPCDCDPVYSPVSLPPSEPLASYSPAELTCHNPQPGELVCSASPSSSSPAAGGGNFTPGPARTVKPPPAATCGVLTHANFTWSNSLQTSGCSPLECASDNRTSFYQGTAALRPIATAGFSGYKGTGTGKFHEDRSSEQHVRVPGPCNWKRSNGFADGRADMAVNASFSINNDVTGGIDTSGMPEDTSVVEILVEGQGLHDEQHYADCEGPKSDSTDTQTVGFDCHFYGVDLYRPGFYQTFKDREPKSGLCTLTLSK